MHNDFEPAETVIANHVLFDQWRQKTRRFGVNKLIFYILMDEVYGGSNMKDSSGFLGRALKVKQE